MGGGTLDFISESPQSVLPLLPYPHRGQVSLFSHPYATNT